MTCLTATYHFPEQPAKKQKQDVQAVDDDYAGSGTIFSYEMRVRFTLLIALLSDGDSDGPPLVPKSITPQIWRPAEIMIDFTKAEKRQMKNFARRNEHLQRLDSKHLVAKVGSNRVFSVQC